MNSLISSIILKITNPKIKLSPEELQQINQYLQFTYSILGKLFIKNYRIFNSKNNTIILFKKIKKHTHYLFLFLNHDQPQIQTTNLKNLKLCLQIINQFRNQPLNQYQIMYIDFNHYTTKLNSIKNTNIQNTILQSYLPKRNYQQLAMESQIQFNYLKRIISNYIDRFGRINQSIVIQQTKNINFSFQIKILIQTINQILAKELIGSDYTSVQSQYWSQYDFIEKQYKYKRRDTLLKGNGKALLIDWIFLKDFDDYLSEDYEKQIQKTIKDYKKKYNKVEVKIYRIENKLRKNRVAYQYSSKIFQYQNLSELASNRNQIVEKQNSKKIIIIDQ